ITARGSALIIRPVHKHRPSNDEVTWNKPPEPTVFTIVAVVAHHEILVRGHYHLFAISSHSENVVREIIILSSRLVIHIVLLSGLTRWDILDFKWVFAIVIYSFDLVFGQNLAVHDDVFSAQAYVIAR